MKKKKIVLAYSGGLDTSVAIKWLMDKGYEVVCFMADVGQGADNENGKKRALTKDAKKCVVEDLKEKFAAEYALRTLRTGALYQGKYNLATALSRPLIAEAMVDFAKKEKADALGHGCTGKGNDQVRFEVTFHIKAPKLKVVAPVREWELTTRESEIDYAQKHGLPIEQTKKKLYSIDKNLWGVSIEGGKLEDESAEPLPETYIIVNPPEKAPDKGEYVTLSFKKGIPVAINSENYGPVELIQALNRLGGTHGIGRVDMIEDRLVGIKSRELYEAPASTILQAGHVSLEELVLDRETRAFKKMLAGRYSELVYYGLWFTPLKEAIDAFVDKTQEHVTGEVKLKLYKGSVTIAGRKSDSSRYKKHLATYGEGDKFDQTLAKGFIDLWALPYKK